jgi:hypothetical protein
MPRNDPSETGGMFIGRRPGTAPVQLRPADTTAGPVRRRFDRLLSAVILFAETLVCLSLWGPQPLAWLWVGSMVNYGSGSITLGIVAAFAGMMVTLFLTLAVLKRIDHAWKLVRRAAGYEQHSGALEWIFVVSLTIAVSILLFWLFIVEGPMPALGT